MIVETRLACRWQFLCISLIGTFLSTVVSINCSGRSNVKVGGACTRDESCTTGVCIRETRQGDQIFWQGGYCSGDCGTQKECLPDSCLSLEDGRFYCVSSCNSNDDCRTGYVCAASVGACLPDCRLGWSCGSSLTCNTETGTCDVPSVTPGPVGAPCTWNVECTSGLCTPEQGTSGPTYWTGGSCTQDCASADCPSGATCMHFESDGSFCVASCATSSDCRSGYICNTDLPGLPDLPGCLPDCSQGWSCGTTFICDGQTGTCVAPSTSSADGGADASPSPDGRRPDTVGGHPNEVGGGKGQQPS
jgi:hypothetical protein